MFAPAKHIPAPLRKVTSRLAKIVGIFMMLFWMVGGFSLLTACTSGGTATLTGEGKLITVPDSVQQTGRYTVCFYDELYGTWGWTQKDIAEEWASKGKQWDDGIATIDGLYLVAVAENFGTTGDKIKFTLEDGTEISCIVADAKSSGDSNYSEWGHVLENGDTNIIEFEALSSRMTEAGGTNPGINGWHEEWGGKKVKTCLNYGGGGKVSNDGLSGCSAGSGLTTDYLEAAKKIASDDSVGYSQENRTRNPDMDCSSFVYYSLKDAGYSEDQIGSYPFNTYGMKGKLDTAGFTWYDFDGSQGEAQLTAGDILWSGDHTEFYLGEGKTLGAHSNYDGQSGDSKGNEVCEANYYDAGYTGYYRPSGGTTHSGGTPSTSGLSGCSEISDTGGKGQDYAAADDWQRNIVDKCYSTNFVADGWCAGWVSDVYANAGYTRPGGNANDMWRGWCTSSDRSQLQVGMTIAVEHSGATGDSWNFGHVGIYIGDNKIMHNESSKTGNSDNGCTITDLDEWIDHYDYSSTVAWGYPPSVGK